MTKSINAVLVSADVAAVAGILAELAVNDKEVLKTFGTTFTEALKKAKVLAFDANEALAKVQAERDAEREALITKLVSNLDGLGLDMETAISTVDAALAKKYGTHEKKGPKFTFPRIAVLYKEKQYNMPLTGNMTAELKEIVKDAGFESNPEGRKAFIEKYAVDAEQLKAALADA